MKIYKQELIAVSVSGFLLFLSFPYFPLGVLSFISLVPVLILLDKEPHSFKRGFRIGYWFGLFFNSLVIYWIANNILISAIAAVFINALHYALVFALYSWTRKNNKLISILLLPFWWTFFEYLREFTDIKFNWLSLAHTMTYYQHFIQFIDITGTLSLTFIIILFNVLIFLIVTSSEKRRKLIFGGAFIVILSGLSLWSMQRYNYWENKIENLPKIKSGLVQPNIDSWKKWTSEFQEKSMEVLLESTEQLINDSINFIVWPETATPFYLRARRAYLDSMLKMINKKNVYLLTGSLDYKFSSEPGKKYDVFNSAFVLGPDKTIQKYDKVKLVPGAEITPFYSIIGIISEYIDLGQGNFSEGDKNIVMKMTIPVYNQGLKDSLTNGNMKKDTVKVACGICYDSAFPDLFQSFINNGAQLFVIITNDGWFGITSGPYQHLQISVLRTIESRRSIIRCANTGISSFINVLGEIEMRTKLEEMAILKSLVSLNTEKTFFDLHLRVVPLFSGLMTILLLSLCFVLAVRQNFKK
ncbi:MAG: apolipoprotein N-acyltransferase [Calditrichia bacterium]|nr:apolipoprotein N-acyltransferase [Calditrichia bacterium]